MYMNLMEMILTKKLETCSDDEMSAFITFINQVRSLFNIDHDLLPELTEYDLVEFRDNPPHYLINRANLTQCRAIWREVGWRQIS